MTELKVGIVLLNWNGWEDTQRCIDSLRLLTYPNFTIIVVDNGSTDDSLEKLTAVPNIILLPQQQNLGFAKGCNVGIEYALGAGCDVVWLLNNDTVVDPSALTYMANELTMLGGKCMVGSTIKYMQQPNKIQCYAGGTINWILGIAPLIKNISKLPKLAYICGASLLTSREVLEKTGGFDPDFFCYWEDTDLSVRAVKFGYSLKCAVQSIVYHQTCSSTANISALKHKMVAEGAVQFYRKHGKVLPIIMLLLLQVVKRICTLEWGALPAMYAGVKAGLGEK